MKTRPYLIRFAYIVLICIIGPLKTSVAQNLSHAELIRALDKCLKVEIDSFPDSTKLWTFALEMEIESQGNKALVKSFRTNHAMGRSVEGSFSALKQLDFRDIMNGEKKRVLVIPFCVLIYGSSDSNRILSIESISLDLKRLFNGFGHKKNTSGFLYRNPYIIHSDKKIYD